MNPHLPAGKTVLCQSYIPQKQESRLFVGERRHEHLLQNPLNNYGMDSTLGCKVVDGDPSIHMTNATFLYFSRHNHDQC